VSVPAHSNATPVWSQGRAPVPRPGRSWCWSLSAAAASGSLLSTEARSGRPTSRSPTARWSRHSGGRGGWQRMLDEGVYATVSDIGDAENISKSYVSRILRLALLARRRRGGDPDRDGLSGAGAGEAGAAAAGEVGRAAPALILNALFEQREWSTRAGCGSTRTHSPKIEASPARSLSLAIAASSGAGPRSSAAWRTSGKRFTSPTEFRNSLGRASTQ
jgi:hypothetical protein